MIFGAGIFPGPDFLCLSCAGEGALQNRGKAFDADATLKR
jgi:hypothetical protein